MRVLEPRHWPLRCWAVVVVVVCGGVLVGCSGTPPQPAAQGAPASTAPPPTAMNGSGAMSHGAGESPGDVALRLEALLGQHSVLVADMMRSRIRSDEDFAQAASAAVTRNTDDLTAVITSLSRDLDASTFRSLWTDHGTAFFNYARAVATNDAPGRADARAKLVQFEGSLGEFFSSASQGRLPGDTARMALTAHVDHLLEQADAYAARDYARADDLYRTAYSHAFSIGHALATTLLPPDQSALLDQPSWRLRSELDRLLGEHIALAVAALRAGAMNSPDFAEAAGVLNRNTDGLTAAMGTLFGAEAGQRFMSLWADHVDALVSYTAGVAGNDDVHRQAALSELRDFENQLAAFLDAATGSKLHAPDLAKAFLAHDEMLTRQVDAAANKDYRQAHDLAYDCYQDMFGLAHKLSDAFGETVAARLPQGGAETGAGGTAGALGAR